MVEWTLNRTILFIGSISTVRVAITTAACAHTKAEKWPGGYFASFATNVVWIGAAVCTVGLFVGSVRTVEVTVTEERLRHAPVDVSKL